VDAHRPGSCGIVRLRGKLPRKENTMTITIAPEDQKDVTRLHLDLAQAVIFLVEVKHPPGDSDSRYAKDKAIESLRMVRQRLDSLGLKHAGGR
jgi:hypothetical protein